MEREKTPMQKHRQALALLCCLSLAACAGPFRLYDGERLPSNETVVIERKKNGYSILSFDGIGPIPDDEEEIAALPGPHRLVVYHRYASDCEGGARGSGNELIGLAAAAIAAAACHATSDSTHCAVLDFVGEAGHTYKITTGFGGTVVLTDLDDRTVVARDDRIYLGDSGENAFLRSCSTMAHGAPPSP